MVQQTVVEWLAEKYNYVTWMRNRDEMSPETADKYRKDYLEEAKQMEKEQIIKAFDDGTEDENLIGIEYYNEKYNSFNSPKKTDNES